MKADQESFLRWLDDVPKIEFPDRDKYAHITGPNWQGDLTCSAVPVQYQGTALHYEATTRNPDPFNWYFRARYEHWSFSISKDDPVRVGWKTFTRDDGEVFQGHSGWRIEKEWPFGGFSAGYMPFKHARNIICICIERWRKGKLEWKSAE